MIPKIIHYCWFGKGEKSELVNKCIESWKQILSDYEIIEWNEDNFDIESIPYVKEAYQCKKYAFVSDYVRLYALYNYGGVYLDTDVEVKKRLDMYLNWNEVFGFESYDRIATAVMFAKEKSDLIKQWLETYHKRNFLSDGKMDMTPNVKELTNILKNNGVILNGKTQEDYNRKLLVCETKVFCPYAIGEDMKQDFENSSTVHWCEGSWVSGGIKLKHILVKGLKHTLGTQRYYQMKRLINSRSKLKL